VSFEFEVEPELERGPVEFELADFELVELELV
jgi:hypothetical protein